MCQHIRSNPWVPLDMGQNSAPPFAPWAGCAPSLDPRPWWGGDRGWGESICWWIAASYLRPSSLPRRYRTLGKEEGKDQGHDQYIPSRVREN